MTEDEYLDMLYDFRATARAVTARSGDRLVAEIDQRADGRLEVKVMDRARFAMSFLDPDAQVPQVRLAREPSGALELRIGSGSEPLPPVSNEAAAKALDVQLGAWLEIRADLEAGMTAAANPAAAGGVEVPGTWQRQAADDPGGIEFDTPAAWSAQERYEEQVLEPFRPAARALTARSGDRLIAGIEQYYDGRLEVTVTTKPPGVDQWTTRGPHPEVCLTRGPAGTVELRGGPGSEPLPPISNEAAAKVLDLDPGTWREVRADLEAGMTAIASPAPASAGGVEAPATWQRQAPVPRRVAGDPAATTPEQAPAAAANAARTKAPSRLDRARAALAAARANQPPSPPAPQQRPPSRSPRRDPAVRPDTRRGPTLS